MAHGYRTLQHWNDWLFHQSLGQEVLHEEERHLTPLVKDQFGKHALLIGVPHQQQLLKVSYLPCQHIVTPLFPKNLKKNYIEANLQELPILTGSQDFVLIPHTLDFVEHPRQLLREACRVVKAEGLLVVFGFNRYSLWGLKKKLTSNNEPPWNASFISCQEVKKWLKLADFVIEEQQTFFFRPPLKNKKRDETLRFLEVMGRILFPFLGGIYCVVARAKVIPLTPIRLHWKQKLPSIRISPSISGNLPGRA